LPPGSEFRLACDASALESACIRYARRYGIRKDALRVRSGFGLVDQQRAAIHQISHCLLHARSRSRDNELFVVIAELAGFRLVDELANTIRMCRAARHRLIVIDTPGDSGSASFTPPAPTGSGAGAGPGEAARSDESPWRAELVRLGVRYARLEDPQLMQIVVNELELLRSARGRSGDSRALSHPGGYR
jgi:hypothetical protein